jgi:preprotein translocase subunit SecY
MKYLAQVISFVSWITGFFISVIARISPIIDDSISLLAGIIGLLGGIIWVIILFKKNKLVSSELSKSEIELDNEILDSKIKNIQLNSLLRKNEKL